MAIGDYKVVSFDVDVFRDSLDAALDGHREAVKRAIYSTMSKARRHARTLMSEIVREKWAIRKSDLDKRLTIEASGHDDHYASFSLIVRGQSVSLAHFGAVENRGTIRQTSKVGRVMKRASKAQGVSVEVLKGRRVNLSRAWFQVVPGWGVAIRRRKNKSRESATIQAVISPASFLNDAKIADRFEEDMIAFIERTFEHELQWRLSQVGAR